MVKFCYYFTYRTLTEYCFNKICESLFTTDILVNNSELYRLSLKKLKL